MVTAAVLNAFGEDLHVHDDIEIAPPGPGEAKVKIVASGVCHSDLSVQNGTIPCPPIVLGHEGAGVVEEVGDGVTTVKPGDHVVLSFVPACGACFYCDRGQGFLCEKSAMGAAGGMLDGSTRLTLRGEPLRQMSMCGTFGNYAIVPE
jgi:S-(hydroxymethyl)glutathione dehydrogenase / alcohol dehydrogenase